MIRTSLYGLHITIFKNINLDVAVRTFGSVGRTYVSSSMYLYLPSNVNVLTLHQHTNQLQPLHQNLKLLPSLMF